MIVSKMRDILRQLEASSSSLEKQDILRTFGNDPDFRQMLDYALNPYKKYGVKQVTFSRRIPAFSELENWSAFKQVLQTLLQGGLSGSYRLSYIEQASEKMSGDIREMFRRILLKDLRCGVGAKLVNKALGDDTIPEFGVMLASEYDEKRHSKFQGQSLYAQPKKNGDRCAIFIHPDGTTEALSRKGFTLHNYKELERACWELWRAAIRKNNDVLSRYQTGAVFDGEVINRDFQGTRSVKKLAGQEAEEANYHIFDQMPMEDWVTGRSRAFRFRLLELKRLFEHNPSDRLVRVPSWNIGHYSWKELNDLHDEVVRLGDEGLILRPGDMVYNHSTRSSLFKYKKMKDGDFTIIEVLEGEEGKKHEGRAGSFVVQLDCECECTCKVGLKMPDATRELMWRKRNTIAGKTAEIQYQEATVNKQGKHSLQFPVFIRFREDKS